MCGQLFPHTHQVARIMLPQIFSPTLYFVSDVLSVAGSILYFLQRKHNSNAVEQAFTLGALGGRLMTLPCVHGQKIKGPNAHCPQASCLSVRGSYLCVGGSLICPVS